MMTSRMHFTLGLDLAQNSFHAALATDPGQIHHWRKLPNASFEHPPFSREGILALMDWMKQVAPEGICDALVVESTGPISSRFAARVAATPGLPVPAIVNPAFIRHFGQSLGLREKTDAFDACVIALYGVIHAPEPTPLRSEAQQEMRELCRLRESFVNRQTAVGNEIKAAYHASVIALLTLELEAIRKRLEQTEAALEKIISADDLCREQVKALRQIKGIGKVTAMTLTAELGDLKSWGRNALVAMAGVFPRRRESGSSVWSPPRMIKGGGHRLRRVLYMCATSTLRSKGPLRDYAQRLLARGMKPMSVIGAVMRKLLLVARAVMKNDGKYEPDKICKISEVTP